MITSRMQLNALIRNKAAGDGDKAQILLRTYMMERLLERISVSGYRDKWGEAVHSVKLLKEQID